MASLKLKSMISLEEVMRPLISYQPSLPKRKRITVDSGSLPSVPADIVLGRDKRKKENELTINYSR